MNRNAPLSRTARLEARTPLRARTALKSPAPWSRSVPLLRAAGSAETVKNAATERKPIRRVSAKRAAENRERAAMADRLWPDRREGTVMCGCGRPECNRRAADLHELLSRARGGSIVDEANVRPLSRHCHDLITFSPESELEWAYSLGLLRHSWDAGGRQS